MVVYSTDCLTDQRFPIQEPASIVSQTRNVCLTTIAKTGGTQKGEAWTDPEIACMRELLTANSLPRNKEAMSDPSDFRTRSVSLPKRAGEVTGAYQGVPSRKNGRMGPRNLETHVNLKELRGWIDNRETEQALRRTSTRGLSSHKGRRIVKE